MAKFSRSAWVAKFKKQTGGGSDWKKARTTEAEASGQRLPAGIVGGVAQLKGYKMAFDKKGNPYVQLQAITYLPDDYTGTKFNIFHFINKGVNEKGEVWKTVEDALSYLVSDLKLLSPDEKHDEISNAEVENVPEILDDLAAAKPFFQFNTWQADTKTKGKTPSLKIYIQSLCEKPEDMEEFDDDSSSGDNTDASDDDANTDASDDTSGDGATADQGSDPTAEDMSIVKGSKVTHEKHGPCTVVHISGDGTSLKLKDKKNKIHAAVAPVECDLVDDTDSSSDDTAATDESNDIPEVDQIYNFRTGPKAPPLPHVVLKVYPKTETVDLKGEKSGKVYKGIKWDKLEGE